MSGVITSEGIARHPRLHASELSAVALIPRGFVGRGERKWIVTPLSCGVIWTVMCAPIDRNARASPTGEDHAEHNGVTHTCPVDCLRRCEAVGVVFYSQRPTQHRIQVLHYGLSIYPCGTSTLAESVRGVDRTGNPYSHSAAATGLAFDAFDQGCHSGQTCAVVPAWRGFTDAQQFHAVRLESDDFYLGATPVNADMHFRTVEGRCVSIGALADEGPKLVDEHLRLIVKVARLYYERNLRQQEIADTLAISQTRVSRLLKEAAERGIVRSIVEVPEGIYSDLESAVESILGLQQVIVVDESEVIERSLGAAAAAYLQSTITSDAVIGVSTWSNSLISMVDALDGKSVLASRGSVKVIQMFGGVGSPDVQFEATRLTSDLARRIGGHALFMPAPAVVGNAGIARALTQDPDVARVMDQWQSITVSLVGIGQLKPSPLLAKSGNAVSAEEMSELRMRGAVGDVCLRYFDAAGQVISSAFDERVIGMSASDIKAVPRRVGVAGGAAKVEAIRAAARGGWVSVLITDVPTAEALVAGSTHGA